MLLVLTIERYVSVCHPSRMRPALGPPRVTVILLPILTLVIYMPSLFRFEVVRCVFYDGSITYYKRDNTDFLGTVFYSVSQFSDILFKKICMSFNILFKIIFTFLFYLVVLQGNTRNCIQTSTNYFNCEPQYPNNERVSTLL